MKFKKTLPYMYLCRLACVCILLSQSLVAHGSSRSEDMQNLLSQRHFYRHQNPDFPFAEVPYASLDLSVAEATLDLTNVRLNVEQMLELFQRGQRDFRRSILQDVNFADLRLKDEVLQQIQFTDCVINGIQAGQLLRRGYPLARMFVNSAAWDLRGVEVTRIALQQVTITREALHYLVSQGVRNFAQVIVDSHSNRHFGYCDLLTKYAGVEVDYTHLIFADADLREIDFSGLTLDGCFFEGAILEHADFAYTKIRNASFAETFLYEAHFSGAELRDVNFTGALFWPRMNAASVARELIRDGHSAEELKWNVDQYLPHFQNFVGAQLNHILIESWREKFCLRAIHSLSFAQKSAHKYLFHGGFEVKSQPEWEDGQEDTRSSRRSRLRQAMSRIFISGVDLAPQPPSGFIRLYHQLLQQGDEIYEPSSSSRGGAD
ncbi:MAG: pentapeptide repeat-containing protein [Zetaproteobacteria bacterium]|nr:pentapeptide repeat-containing protein [Zetaproteobacteria bacterium]